MDPRHAVSRALQVCSAEPDLPNLQHAVVSAEDARFYEHHGFDGHQVQIDAAGDLEGGLVRT
jgi:membrane carboxypeptidase/penicillin-binding protein